MKLTAMLAVAVAIQGMVFAEESEPQLITIPYRKLYAVQCRLDGMDAHKKPFPDSVRKPFFNWLCDVFSVDRTVDQYPAFLELVTLPTKESHRSYAVWAEQSSISMAPNKLPWTTDEVDAASKWLTDFDASSAQLAKRHSSLSSKWFLTTTPALYETRTEEVMVKPPRAVKVEIPATYKIVTTMDKHGHLKDVLELATEAAVAYHTIPAEFKTVSKQVEVRPAGKGMPGPEQVEFMDDLEGLVKDIHNPMMNDSDRRQIVNVFGSWITELEKDDKLKDALKNKRPDLYADCKAVNKEFKSLLGYEETIRSELKSKTREKAAYRNVRVLDIFNYDPNTPAVDILYVKSDVLRDYLETWDKVIYGDGKKD